MDEDASFVTYQTLSLVRRGSCKISPGPDLFAGGSSLPLGDHQAPNGSIPICRVVGSKLGIVFGGRESITMSS